MRLQIEGLKATRSAVSAWELGRNRPALERPEVRRAFVLALRISEEELLRHAGLHNGAEHRSQAAEIGAEIIDSLPAEKQDLALRLLEQLRAS